MSAHQAPASTRQGQAINSVSPSSTPTYGFFPDLGSISGGSWVIDLELMHHYSTVTYATFPPAGITHTTFKEDIPRIAFRFPYLLHQILAISALHIAYLKPESRQEYLLRASQHQSQSITGMREALLGEMNETSSPIFLTSEYLMACSFASRPGAEESATHSDHLDGMIEVMTLLRGTEAIQTQAAERLRKRPADNIFIDAASELIAPSSLHCVTDQLYALSSHVQGSMVLETYEKTTLESAIKTLIDDLSISPRSRIVESPELRTVSTGP